MAYSKDTLDGLTTWLRKSRPSGASVLDLGDQDIAGDASREDIRNALINLHGTAERADAIMAVRFSRDPPWKVAELFRGSNHIYRCIDAFPGEFTTVADLNTFVVPPEERGTIDLVVNQGTTEHIADQMNAFRVMHDYAKVGGVCVHAVPFHGYFNHGLYNYHPIFFVFLAQANNYRLVNLSMSAPHLPYTIPYWDWMEGASHWTKHRIESGIIGCVLLKRSDAPFALFSDVDRTVVKRIEFEKPWAEMFRGRYDLRVL